MNSREKFLAIATAIAAVIGAVVIFMPEEGGVSSPSATGAAEGSLEMAEARFAEYEATIKNGEAIKSDYQRLAVGNPESDGKSSPGDASTNELAVLLRDEFHQPVTRIDPYQMSAIEGVEDYYFIDLKATIEGTVDDLMRLLGRMEQRGMLIKEFVLEQRGGGRRQQATLNVTVSRLFQHDDNSRRRLRNLLRR